MGRYGKAVDQTLMKAKFFQILFSEFVDWALKKDLDLEDDIDVEIPE